MKKKDKAEHRNRKPQKMLKKLTVHLPNMGAIKIIPVVNNRNQIIYIDIAKFSEGQRTNNVRISHRDITKFFVALDYFKDRLENEITDLKIPEVTRLRIR